MHTYFKARIGSKIHFFNFADNSLTYSPNAQRVGLPSSDVILRNFKFLSQFHHVIWRTYHILTDHWIDRKKWNKHFPPNDTIASGTVRTLVVGIVWLISSVVSARIAPSAGKALFLTEAMIDWHHLKAFDYRVRALRHELATDQHSLDGLPLAGRRTPSIGGGAKYCIATCGVDPAHATRPPVISQPIICRRRELSTDRPNECKIEFNIRHVTWQQRHLWHRLITAASISIGARCIHVRRT